jgi:hypothetical protein
MDFGNSYEALFEAVSTAGVAGRAFSRSETIGDLALSLIGILSWAGPFDNAECKDPMPLSTAPFIEVRTRGAGWLSTPSLKDDGGGCEELSSASSSVRSGSCFWNALFKFRVEGWKEAEYSEKGRSARVKFAVNSIGVSIKQWSV